MGRARKIGNKLPPFVPLIWELLNSKAYKDLAPSAAKALPYFLGKVQNVPFKSVVRYSINFDLSYREAKRYGFATSTHHKTICQLVEKGFIDPVKRGGLRSYGRSYNRFCLSRRWENYGTDDFNKIDWKESFQKDQ